MHRKITLLVRIDKHKQSYQELIRINDIIIMTLWVSSEDETHGQCGL